MIIIFKIDELQWNKRNNKNTSYKKIITFVVGTVTPLPFGSHHTSPSFIHFL